MDRVSLEFRIMQKAKQLRGATKKRQSPQIISKLDKELDNLMFNRGRSCLSL